MENDDLLTECIQVTCLVGATINVIVEIKLDEIADIETIAARAQEQAWRLVSDATGVGSDIEYFIDIAEDLPVAIKEIQGAEKC